MSKGSDFTEVNVKLRKGVYIFLKIFFSFNSAAYYVLWLKFLQVILSPLDYIAYWIEKSRLKTIKKSELPIIFVIGIQRTGSTLVSQFIQQMFDFFPIGNFNAIFKHSAFYLHRWFAKVYKNPHKSYKNFYGISRGFYSIGDCYELWDKWFGKNHYVIPEQISDKKQDALKEYFALLYDAYKRPILTKNNRNSLLLPILEKNFDNAFYVIVKRDPVAVIRSTIKASKDFFGNEKYLWGLYPSQDFDTVNYENIVEAATVQFLMLDKILNEQIKNLQDEVYLIIDYNEFCLNPAQFQKKLIHKLKSRKLYNLDKIKLETESFSISNRLKNHDIDNQIRNYLKKWQNKI